MLEIMLILSYFSISKNIIQVLITNAYFIHLFILILIIQQ